MGVSDGESAKKKRATGDVAIALSGGIDSVTLLYEAEAEGRLRGAWHVDYGQGGVRQEREICGRYICEWGLVGHGLTIPIAGHTAMLNEPGAEGLRIVPGRNLIILSTIASWAAAYSIDEVWFGATQDDVMAGYSDCAHDFIESLNESLAQSEVKVKIRAPWIEYGRHWSKRDVVKRARELGVRFAQTWSCYTPNDYGKACETCTACRNREAALSAPPLARNEG